MTEAQRQAHIEEYIAEFKYKQRQYRLAAIRDFNVRIEVTEDLKKCYVMSHLVVCLPKSRSYRLAFDDAVQTVLDTLVAVNSSLVI